MAGYIIKRLAIVVVSLLALITLSFGLVSLIPGDPGHVILGDFATRAEVAQVDHRLGLDQPLVSRYFDYLGHVVQGNLGTSYFTNLSVGHSLLTLTPNTLVILVPGLVLAILIGLSFGSVGAYFSRRPPDRVVKTYITTAQAVPSFIIGLLLIYVVFYRARIAPAPIGMLSSSAQPPPQVTGSTFLDAILSGSSSTLGSIASHAVLPVITIAIFASTPFAKATRSGLSVALDSSQVEFARACGLPERRVFWYAVTGVRTSLLTFIAIAFGATLGGTAIVENVFSWPGVGQWSLQGVIRGDVPVIQGFVLAMGVATLLAYLVLDVVVMILDPRTRPF
jgi:peptide/nickel transport system permease protein